MTGMRIFALLLALLGTSSWAANLGVTPVAIHMGAAVNRTTVSIVNNGPAAVTMQAETIAWKRVDGVDQDSETSDVMVNPAVFTVEPGQTQIVRVGLRRPNEQAVEATYRLVLREVPVARDPVLDGTSVRVLVAMRLPIYVAPDKVVLDEQWHVVADARNNLLVTLHNRGNVHYKVGSIKVRADEQKGSNTVPFASSSDGAVLFPGESRTFTLKQAQARPLKKMPITLEVFTDRGPQYISTELQKGE